MEYYKKKSMNFPRWLSHLFHFVLPQWAADAWKEPFSILFKKKEKKDSSFNTEWKGWNTHLSLIFTFKDIFTAVI